MSIQLPNVINNITSSQIVTQSGQACVPANLLDQNFSALANPVNPVISVTGNISLSISNSGNIYELNAPTANSTITLPTPTNGFNVVFVCNNSSSYTYTFTTPSGSIIWNNTSSASVTLNTANGVYLLVSDSSNYLLSYRPSAPNSISVTGGDLTMSGVTGTAITNATLVTTGVTAGTYGSSTQIPSITFDAKGRATSASNNNISFPTGGNVVVTTISNSFSMANSTTYTVGSFTVTFPSFSPTGKWKIIIQLSSSITNNTNTNPSGNNYTQTITDGTNSVNGAAWMVFSNNGWNFGVEDTIVMGDYAQGSQVTFTVKIGTAGGSASSNTYNQATIRYAFIY